QANIYREEKNLIDLYVMLLRYSSLLMETIPFHRDYQTSYLKERNLHKKKLLGVIDELEILKPQVNHQISNLEKIQPVNRIDQFDTPNTISNASSYSRSLQTPIVRPGPLRQTNEFSPSNSIGTQLQKLSLNLPAPKLETLSRHSLLGSSGLNGGQWVGRAEVKVNYPTNIVAETFEPLSLNQTPQEHLPINDIGDSKKESSDMECVLSLDDGRWLAEDARIPPENEWENNDVQYGNIRQPSPPPVMARVQPDVLQISSAMVADPRPGPPKLSQDGLPGSNTYQDLHIPVKIMDDFLRLARENTAKNLETCGVLAGSLVN
ncbi:hypothetical protein M569_09410, partial [Genlisea aurea]